MLKKSKLRQLVYLSILASCSAYADSIDGYMPTKKVYLGQGVDYRNISINPTLCFSHIPALADKIQTIKINGEKIDKSLLKNPIESALFRLKKISSEQDLISTVSESISAKANAKFGAVSGGFNYSQSTFDHLDFHSDSLHWMLFADIDFGDVIASEIELTELGKAALKNSESPDEFYSKCGTHFVSSQNRFALVVAVYSARNISNQIISEVEESMSAHAKGASFSGKVRRDFSSFLNKLSKIASVSAYGYFIGANSIDVVSGISNDYEDFGAVRNALSNHIKELNIYTSAARNHQLTIVDTIFDKEKKVWPTEVQLAGAAKFSRSSLQDEAVKAGLKAHRRLNNQVERLSSIFNATVSISNTDIVEFRQEIKAKRDELKEMLLKLEGFGAKCYQSTQPLDKDGNLIDECMKLRLWSVEPIDWTKANNINAASKAVLAKMCKEFRSAFVERFALESVGDQQKTRYDSQREANHMTGPIIDPADEGLIYRDLDQDNLDNEFKKLLFEKWGHDLVFAMGGQTALKVAEFLKHYRKDSYVIRPEVAKKVAEWEDFRPDVTYRVSRWLDYAYWAEEPTNRNAHLDRRIAAKEWGNQRTWIIENLCSEYLSMAQ